MNATLFFIFLSQSFYSQIDQQIRNELQNQKFESAILKIDQALNSSNLNNRDELIYLKAISFYNLKQFDNSIKTCDQIQKDHRDSAWFRKSIFLKAKSLFDLKRFSDAEKIYANEVDRLLSADRKSEIAKVYIDFAESVSRQPDPNELDAPPPNFQKAHTLYQKAIELEIEGDLKADLTFRLGKMMQSHGDFHRAIHDYNSYLDQFSEKNDRYFQAKFSLAECKIAVDQHNFARLELEDLLRDDKNSDRIQNAKFLLTRTFHFPKSTSDVDLALGEKSAIDYIQNYSDLRATQLKFEIGEAFRHHGRSENAVTAFQNFLDQTDNSEHDQKIESRGQTVLDLKMSALFQIGDLRFDQGKYETAISIWNRYLAEFPNASQWTQAQQKIIDAEFQIGIKFLTDEKTDQAISAFDRFQIENPLDPRVPQILLIYAQISHEKGDFRKAISEWEKLVNKYPGIEESSFGLLQIGITYEEKINNLEKALESYRRLTWGSWQNQARDRLRKMTEKSLDLSTDRTFRTNESAKVRLKTRNVEKVRIDLYEVDLEAYWRKMHEIRGVENLDLDLIAADKTWEHSIGNYAKFQPFDQEIEIAPPNENGKVYAVKISDEDLESTTLIIHSDLEIISKTSRNEILIFTQNSREKKVIENVEVLISDGSKVIAEGKTNSDGVFHRSIDGLRRASSVRIFAIKNGNVASSQVNLRKLQVSKGLIPKGYIYTDRPAYRPGQIVKLRGVIRDVKNGVYAISDQAKYRIEISDSQGRILHSEIVELSTFGTFSAIATLDENATIGTYQIIATEQTEDPNPKTFSQNFEVQRFQTQKIELALNFDQDVYFRGETVKATFTTRYYYGQPLRNADLRYTLPNGRSIVKKTDENGKLIIEFDTTDQSPDQMLGFSGVVEGENVSIAKTVLLARLGFQIAVETPSEITLAGETIEIPINTVSANGKPIGKKLDVEILRIEKSPVHPILSKIPWFDPGRQTAEVSVEKRQIETDPKTGSATISLTLDLGGDYVIRANGTDRFDQPVIGQNRFKISGDKDKIKLLIIADSIKTKVGSTLKIRVHSRLDDALALITFEGDRVLGYRVVDLKKGDSEISIEIEHAHFPNFYFSISAIDGRKLRSTVKEFKVERQLNVEIVQKNDSIYAPGSTAEIEIVAKDHNGKPIIAEFSLALIDEALFAIFPDQITPIDDFFHADIRRESAMRSASSCGFRYSPPTRKVIKEFLAESERLDEERKRIDRLLRFHDRDKAEDVIMRLEERLPQSAAAPMQSQDASRSMLRSSGRAGREFSKKVRKPSIRGLAKLGAIENEVKEVKLGEALYFADQGIAAGEIDFREEFESAGFWLPTIETDKNGRAVTKIDLPEKTSRWRITVRGCSIETLVGETKVNATTKKDLFLDLKLPSIVTEGDKLRISAKLHTLIELDENTTEIRLNCADQFQRKQIEAKSNGTVDLIFDPIEVPNDDILIVELVAKLGDHSDAIRREIPIRPWGMEYADTKAGISQSDQAIFVELPKDRDYRRKRLTIELGQKMDRLIYDLAMHNRPRIQLESDLTTRAMSFNGSIIFPPGDVGSDLLAVVSAIDYVKNVGGNATDNRKLRARARTLITQLISRQLDNGMWAWAGNDPDLRVTARNLWALSEADRIGGLLPNKTVIEKSINVLINTFSQIDQRDDELKAIVLHALSNVGKADFAFANRLYRNRNQIQPKALAYTALIFVNLDRNELSREILSIITNDKINFNKTESDLEAVAISTLAMQKVDPSSPWIRRAIDFMLSRRRYFGFTPHHTKGMIVAALAENLAKTRFADTDLDLKILVNGDEIEKINLRSSAPNLRIEIDSDQISDGKNRIDLKMNGRGRLAYSINLSGFSAEITDVKSWDKPYVVDRKYFHSRLTHNGKPISVDSSTLITQLEAFDLTQVFVDVKSGYRNDYIVIDEFFPAGTTFVDGSLSGSFSHIEIGDGMLRLYFRPNQRINDFRYQLRSFVAGDFRILPTVIRSVSRSGEMRIGGVDNLTILAQDEKSIDVYKMNDAELFTLGKLNFNDGNYETSRDLLSKLHDRNPRYNERETARMLLWIYTSADYYQPQKAIEAFEILRERQSDLYIPFDKIRRVGQAYRDIGEFERSALVHRATIDASFSKDSSVSAVIEDEGEFLKSIDFLTKLWREYPDTPMTISTNFAIPQSIYAKVPSANSLKPKVSKSDLLKQIENKLQQFLTFYSTDPLADDAALSLTNVFLDLDDFSSAVKFAKRSQDLYAKSEFINSFRYAESLAYFSQSKFDQAIDIATVVAEGNSEDRDLARYILGQIYHAQGETDHAINWYNRVKSVYPDAKESIENFERKSISIPEVTIKTPSEISDLKKRFPSLFINLKYRNIKEIELQIYKVDLMRLYLREKSLSQITKVKLAGISPELIEKVTLGDGKDYAEKSKKIAIKISDEGAYLVICRGDDLFTSGLILITPLKMEAEEDLVSGRIRVNVKSSETNDPASDVHVKAIGSANQNFVSGETDLRGIFIADGLSGISTVIARSDNNRYAFYRGSKQIAPRAEANQTKEKQQFLAPRPQADYKMNLRSKSSQIQSSNIDQLEQIRRQTKKGVQVQKAY